MMNIFSLVNCEIRKVYKSTVFWVVTVAFTLLPGISLIKYSNPALSASWMSYLSDTLETFVSLLIMGFAFTTCWMFGREYTDKTISDLLVKPVSKLRIAGAKFIVTFLWNVLLTALMFAVVVLVGAYVGLSGSAAPILHYLGMFMATSLLLMFVSTVSSFMANVTRGYLAPIGLIFIIVLLVNIASNTGLDAYIPWTIPGLLMSEGFLRPISVLILAVTGITGLVGTIAWWRFKEQI